MKKAILSLLVILGFTFNYLMAQAPAGFETGSVVLANNTKLEGFVKESLASKGSVSFATTSGSKKTYSVSDLNGFSYKNDIYIVYSNDFYKTVLKGSKVSLYQKQSNNSGKLLYNGSEAFTATTTAGNIGDFYIQLNNSDDLLLVNTKNFETVILKEFASCNSIIADIKSKQLDFAQLNKVVDRFNNCK